MQLLAEALPAGVCRHRADAATQLWWEIESRLREDLSQPVSLQRLQTLGRRSLRPILHGCRAATGTSPMKRVKEMRLSYARGLVLHSRLSMTEIALRVGYGRVQEMSRDYHRQFGLTPRADRTWRAPTTTGPGRCGNAIVGRTTAVIGLLRGPPSP